MTYNEIAHQVNHKGGSTLIYKEDILLLQSIYLTLDFTWNTYSPGGIFLNIALFSSVVYHILSIPTSL